MSSRIMIKDIETALDIYYKYPEIGTPEIMRLFGCGRSTAGTLKRRAREVQDQQQKLTFSPLNVNTKCAFEAWHIDVADLEKRALKLQRFRSRMSPDDPDNKHAFVNRDI